MSQTELRELSRCYKLLYELNRGSYGTIYCGESIDGGIKVALKMIPINKQSGSQQLESSPLAIRRELQILWDLRGQENIVELYEVLESENGICICTELLDIDLPRLMDQMARHLLLSEVKSIMIQLNQALLTLKHHQIIHRDIKTSNLLLHRDGTLKLCDFGLSRYVDDTGGNTSNLTPNMVTLWYRAPEIFVSGNRYSFPADVWSAGTVFIEILMAEPMFAQQTEIAQLRCILDFFGIESIEEDAFNDCSQIATVKPITLLKLGAELPENISEATLDLISGMLELSPDIRPTPEDIAQHEYFKELPAPKSLKFEL